MLELEYDEFLDLMSHQQSWIACELGENLSEVLLEEMNENN
jgi:hypothetical protein